MCGWEDAAARDAADWQVGHIALHACGAARRLLKGRRDASPEYRRLPGRRGVAEVAALLDRFGAAVGGDAGFLVGEGLGVDRVGVDDLLELGLEAGADAALCEPLPGSDLPLRENLTERSGLV